MSLEKICCFCGHGKEWDLPIDIDNRIESAIIELIADGVLIYYSGGMGAFDNKCEAVVRKLKRKDKRIKLILVIPYITKRIDDLYREKRYDEIIFPDLGNVHYKAAIQKRNYWMVDNSDYLLAYVKNREGGARKSFEYAKRRGKKIVRL